MAILLDGGPSLFFETKVAHVAKYPNGTPGMALVRETNMAKIYVWNGSIWEDFEDYQGIDVKDGTITLEKLSENLRADVESEIYAIQNLVKNGNFANSNN